MIIMGNADLLSSCSDMWATVIDDLRKMKRLGPGLLISCYNHPDYIKRITEPEMIPLVSPDGRFCPFHLKLVTNQPLGGCLRPCSKRFDCGHSCPLKVSWDQPLPLQALNTTRCLQCHADDHAALHCHERCRKVCPQGHPCHLECWQSCGDCQWPIAQVELPCGHRQDNIPWSVGSSCRLWPL
jgi:hypothetical protein